MPQVASPATLDELVAAFPGRGDDPAILTFGNDGNLWSVTYATLHEELTRLAARLGERGVAIGTPVLLWAPNSPAWISAYLGIAAAGGVVIPLDDQADTDGLRVVLRQSSPACIITVYGHLEALRVAGAPERTPLILLDRDDDARNWRRLPGEGMPVPRNAGPAQRVAALLYTSGTTGTPKGVPLTHANLLSNVRALLEAGIVTGRDRVLVPLPLHHAYPATVGMLTVLARGAAIVLPAGITGPELTRAVDRTNASILVGVPRLYEALLESIRAGVRTRGPAVRAGFAGLLRSAGALRRRFGINPGRVVFRSVHRRVGRSLRVLASGGARLDAAIAKELEALGWLVLTGYGLTETSPVVTFNVPGCRRLEAEGRALAGVELRIAAASGEGKGEIQVRGPNVFSGYWQDPEATARAFTADGWFRTGDEGFLDGGFLHVLGRRSEVLVLSDGKKISPEELERRYEASPYIREVALLAPRGELVALVVPDDDAIRGRGAMSERTLLRDELDVAMCALPSWQRVREYRLARQHLPRTRLGKLRRHLLPALYAQAAAPRSPAAASVMSGADSRLLESARVRSVWHWLSARYPDVHPDSSPQLDLGIDSLGWVSLTAEMEDRFGVSLGSEQLSRVLTVRDLLQAVDAAPDAGRSGSTGSGSRTADAAHYLEVPGPALRFLGALVMACVRLVMAGPYRLRVAGREHLPAEGPFLIAPNHASYLDPLAVAAALPPALRRQTCWAGWARKMHKGPARRTVSRALRVFPVDPDRDLGRAVRLAARVLEAGDGLVWFPEGRRSHDGALQPFRRGIGVLLEQVSVPVVPARIGGTFAAWPPQRRWPRLRPVTIAFGPAESPASLRERGTGGDGAARIAHALAQRVAEL